MKQKLHRRPVALVSAGLWVCLLAGCVTTGPTTSQTFSTTSTNSSSAQDAAAPPTAATVDQTDPMPGSLQSKLARQFRRLGLGWQGGKKTAAIPAESNPPTVDQAVSVSAAGDSVDSPAPDPSLGLASSTDQIPHARISDARYDTAAADATRDEHVRPVAYEQVPGEKHYANPTPLSRDAAGLLPGDPYAPAPVVPGPYGPVVPGPYGPLVPGPYGPVVPGPYGAPAQPYSGYDEFGTPIMAPPMDHTPMDPSIPIEETVPNTPGPSNIDDANRQIPADVSSPRAFQPGLQQPDWSNETAPDSNGYELRSTEELPAPPPVDDSAEANPLRRDIRAVEPQRRVPTTLQSQQPTYTFGDQRPGAAAPGSAAYPTETWDAATMTGRGYLAAGSAMHGSQLRSTPLTATEIALQLKQENETLRERMRFSEAAQRRAENRLSSVESELANLQRELAEAKQSIARLSVANRKLDQQLAAERAEKERLRQHSDAALRNIEETLDTVLLNTISPRK